jgi:site-specific DNA-adenine methylase
MDLGIPYMGSKRKLAPKIIRTITYRHSEITDFYDLFGGGGSVSFLALKDYNFNVHYNELNTHIFSLVEYLKNNKNLDPKFYNWVSREEFQKQCNRTDADWYSGFVMSCWSFGNNQQTYLYGKEIEESKKLAHDIVVNLDEEAMFKLGLNISELFKIKDLHKRRTIFRKNSRLEHLERLERLEHLEHLEVTNKSYEDVLITGDNPVIYCDIPYKGTAKYKEGDFDHDTFYEWFSNLDFPAYMSEYSAPFERVEMFKHRGILSQTSNNAVFESLFWNGKGDINNYKLF